MPWNGCGGRVGGACVLGEVAWSWREAGEALEIPAWIRLMAMICRR